MRKRPRRKQLVLQTLGTARVVRIVVYDDEARRWVESEASEYGVLRKERGVDNVYWLAIDQAYDQIEVEAYISSWPERAAERA
ncbi:MAG TPA: hypothetical protein VNL77_25210 [Roseiflexaceae bacterium]|nr:hypothetical protein [Roseiflexaceae bacterium]